MKARVLAARSWSVAGADARLGALPDAEGPFLVAPDPPRPETVPAGSWRRFSRAARLAAASAAPILDAVEDRASLALFWGTGIGEFSSSAAFLRTLFTKGPAGASPLVFQNAVHNAAPGHLSIAWGLRGPSETLCAGPLTTFRVLERALAWVAVHGAPALVVLADDLGPDVQQGFTYAGSTSAMGEGSAAVLLAPDGDGPEIAWEDAPPRDTDWHRAGAFPGEEPPLATGRAHDRKIGLFAAADLVALVSCVQAGEGAVAWGGRGGPARVVVRG